MGLRTFLKRADTAVQDTKQAVSTGVVVAVLALITAVVAVIIAVVRR